MYESKLEFLEVEGGGGCFLEYSMQLSSHVWIISALN